MPNPIEMPPPYAFAPLEMLLVGEMTAELALNVDDDAVQLLNVLLETVRLLLLTMVLPMNVLEPLL
jgi:hypothetical protein